MLCDRMSSRISLVSLMGMLEYMLDMSSEANREVEVNRVCFSSSIKCFVFFTLKAKGSGTSCCILCVNSFASLYAGALHHFTIGRIGRSGLCIFTRPLMVGADGLRLVYFHLDSGFISLVLLLITFLICFWKVFMGSVLEIWKWSGRVGRRGLSITDLTLSTFSGVRAVRARPVDVLFME